MFRGRPDLAALLPVHVTIWEATGIRYRDFNSTAICTGIASWSSDVIALDKPGRCQNVGIATRSPPFMADSWAQRPTMVQLAEVSASGRAGRSPRIALSKAWTRCGCEPPWPPPWRNDRCVGVLDRAAGLW